MGINNSIQYRRAESPHAPPVGKGRLLGVGDIIERLTVTNKNGELVGPSPWTVTHHVCPAGKMKLGGECYWWQSEFEGWLESTKQGSGRRGASRP